MNFWIFVPRGPINNIPTMVQVMAWPRPGNKPLSEPMMVRLPTHICVTPPQWVNGDSPSTVMLLTTNFDMFSFDFSWGPFYWHGLTLIPAWISDYIHYKVWYEIIYPLSNSNGATDEVWEWISNFIPHFTGHVISLNWPVWAQILHMLQQLCSCGICKI